MVCSAENYAALIPPSASICRSSHQLRRLGSPLSPRATDTTNGSESYASARAWLTPCHVVFASIRERLEFSDYPKSFEGFPIALVTAGLMAMAFMGFSGLKIW